MKTILFMGDSITDGNRYKDEKDRWDLNHQMGHSFAYIINGLLGSMYPQKDFKFINRGISGNRILEMYGRMYEDIVELKPDIVSILAGVNDGPLWEHAHHATGVKSYGTIYRMMLSELKEALPEVKLILCEPFLGQNGLEYDEDKESWFTCIREYQEEVRKIAEEFDAVFVPLQECFNDAFQRKESKYWIWDGVHPTESGHGLIARQWLKYTKQLLEEETDEIYEI